MGKFISLAIVAGLCQLPVPGGATADAAQPIKLLIVDGYSNHDWQRTTRLIRGILEPTKLFALSVATAPASTNDPAWATWRPPFPNYDVVIQTCNDISGGPPWPPAAQAAFEKFVREGGGVFIFHSANNAFPHWAAYNQMLGLGWRKKDYGAAITINADGTLRRIPPGEGAGTSHGDRTDRVIHRLGDDPIHSGMPRRWKTPQIEVYTYARGPAENLSVLSWAEEPKTRTRWPIEWVVKFGKGRCYNSTFGHVWRGETDPVDMRCAGFQTIMVRALQWLAQRPVTWPVPSDFPTETNIVLRPLPTDRPTAVTPCDSGCAHCCGIHIMAVIGVNQKQPRFGFPFDRQRDKGGALGRVWVRLSSIGVHVMATSSKRPTFPSQRSEHLGFPSAAPAAARSRHNGRATRRACRRPA